MPKLYAIMEGLVGVATTPGGGTKVLLVKTHPEDRDALNQPLMPHLPRVNFRSGGQLKVQELKGEDIQFLFTGQPAAHLVSDLSRLPSFSRILSFVPKTNGHKAAQLPQIRTGCIGGTPGTACLAPGGQNPRLAGRVLIDQGTLTSIQVDDNGNPYKAPPARFQFRFVNNAQAPALDMKCDNALLLKIDSGSQPIQMRLGQQTLPLSIALQNEKDAAKVILDDPAEDCVIVRVTDMVDPMMMKQMMMENGADVHFPIFLDLLNHYSGPKVIPTLVHGPGDPPLSRCIPPLIP